MRLLSIDHKKILVRIITIIPIIKPLMRLFLLYFWLSLKISFMDIEIIRPAVNNKMILIIKLEIYLYKIKYASKAPRGSDMALIKVNLIAFTLLLVE